MLSALIQSTFAAVVSLSLSACDNHDHTQPANPAGAAHAHDHGDAAPLPKTFGQLATMLTLHADHLAQHLAPATTDAHEAADESFALAQLARAAGKIALDDATFPRDKVRDANLIGKDLTGAADALHELADAAKLDDARSRLAPLRALIDKLTALVPERWVCEMHCEPGKVYDKPGKCPVCKMALSKEGEVPYSVVVTAASPVLEADKTVDLKVQLLDQVGLGVGKLDIVHEKPLHFLTVSNDLAWFSHEHPRGERAADGSFKISLTFPHPGDYTFFADFTPAGAGQQVPSSPITIPGTIPAAKTFTEDIDHVQQIDGYTVRMRCNGGPFFVGRDSLIRYGISIGLDTVTDLEPYLGAIGHLVIISKDLTTFVHAHPINGEADHDHSGHDHAEHAGHDHGGATPESLMAQAAKFGNGTSSDPVFHVVFAKPGIYRAFAQFQHKGKVITVPYTIDVKPEDGSPPPFPPTGSEHKHHTDGAGGGK